MPTVITTGKVTVTTRWMVIVIDMVIVITIAPVTVSNNDSAADMILMDKINIHIKTLYTPIWLQTDILFQWHDTNMVLLLRAFFYNNQHNANAPAQAQTLLIQSLLDIFLWPPSEATFRRIDWTSSQPTQMLLRDCCSLSNCKRRVHQ